MSLPVSSKGADIEPVPAGTHHAVCYGICDLGTQPGGKFSPTRKVLFIWELPQERREFERDGKKVNLPRAISARFTQSLNSKATLRKILESWRGRLFTDEELNSFDLKNVMGANCFLSVVHKPGTGANQGRIYANVAGVSALPKGTPILKAENPSLWFSFYEALPNEPITLPANMPDWVKALVTNSDEYAIHEQQVGNVSPPHEPEGPTIPEDDVPF